MLAFKLAIKNLLGAGLRTWLNVSVLSVAFVVIIFFNGMLEGWNRQARRDTKEWYVAGGQLWHKLYDPYDTYTLQDAHAPIDNKLIDEVTQGHLLPVLILQATAYPQGRMMNVLMKGIKTGQEIINIPTERLVYTEGTIPAVIGKRMAENAGLKTGDRMLIRWRDANGTFDAREIEIVEIFASDVPSVDNNQIWLPINALYEMTGLTGEATILIAKEGYIPQSTESFTFKDEKVLLKEIEDIINAKKGGSSIIFIILLALALLAIFDTQILSIFRRQKEIGTYIALGMTRWRVVRIFTIEGSTHSLLAIILGIIWGIPILLLLQVKGIPMPSAADATGVSIGTAIYPYYSAGIILSTVLLVIISATIVSYLPTRRISEMKPTEALKGKLI